MAIITHLMKPSPPRITRGGGELGFQTLDQPLGMPPPILRLPSFPPTQPSPPPVPPPRHDGPIACALTCASVSQPVHLTNVQIE